MLEENRQMEDRRSVMNMRLTRGTRLGKYRIVRRIDDSHYSTVYQARDMVEDIPVALKVPLKTSDTSFSELLSEVRIAARLNHPNILKPKNADIIKGRLVIAYDLGVENLAERLTRRLSAEKALEIMKAITGALAEAHAKRILHLDVKPENIILVEDEKPMLADFGIARVAKHTALSANGEGTIGYMAPEQAYGRPSFASDVFSAGLILYRMLSGQLPTWPFYWPFRGLDRVRRKVPRALVEVIKKATAFDPRNRYRNCGAMAEALEKTTRHKKRTRTGKKSRTEQANWPELRAREFKRAFGRRLKLGFTCYRCEGPISEQMHCCPWCGAKPLSFKEVTSLKLVCPDCDKGVMPNWSYCPWCFGSGFVHVSPRQYSYPYSDTRCANRSCREPLPPYARYCPWCHRKVRKPWRHAGLKDKCPSCGWEVDKAFMDHCPWCARRLQRRLT
jgi:serine/threonine-protein kinase